MFYILNVLELKRYLALSQKIQFDLEYISTFQTFQNYKGYKTMELFELKNKSVLITGSRGIGKSIAWQCAKIGAKVIISSRKYDVCEATAKSNDDIGGNVAFPIACNISDKDQLANLVIQSKELIGQIDVLVCNAASNPHMGSSLEISEEAFDKIINNIKSNHLMCILFYLK